MARYFSQARSYTPLDDTEEFNEDLNLNSISNENAEDLDPHSEQATPGFRKLVFMVKCVRIPRINFSYFESRCGKKTRTTICDVFICLFALSSILSICIGLGYHAIFVLKPAPVIDKSYQSFRIPNHQASLHYGALQAAKKNHTSFSKLQLKDLRWFNHHHKRSATQKLSDDDISNPFDGSKWKSSRERRSAAGNIEVDVPTQYYPEWKMQVVFVTDGDKNIFTKEKLLQIHDIEKKIMSHQNYTDFCFKDDMHSAIVRDPAVKAMKGCAPLNSLMTYFFPSKDAAGNVFYDGLGENMDNIDSALKLAMTSDHFYYYVDDKVNSSNRKSQLLRTEVLFGAPLKGFTEPYSDKDKQRRKFKEFVVSYIDVLSKASTNDMSVLYGGQEIFDYEVEMTFWNDVKLAIYAFVAIFLLMLILTSGSVWLTVWGLIAILLSAPLAIFFYRVVFKVIGLGILNGAAAFVIIGIGVDDVFVFINVFRQADHLTNPRARTLYTIKTAGKATFFTSFTTAAAFAANIASMIPAVHDFGLFMSLIVANCWITVMIVMPPVLYIWYISFWKCETKIANLICCCLPSCLCSNLTLPSDVAHFMDSNHGNPLPVPLTPEVIDEDADVPMLSMDPPLQYVDDDDDDESMVFVDPDPLMIPDDDGGSTDKSHSHLGAKLQALLYYGIALPIIKVRWIILGISFVLLCVSIGLMTQLQTSTKPPQFFQANTNMQKLLDLKSKFGAIDTVQCYDCSAIYNIDQNHPMIPTPISHPGTPRTRTTQKPAPFTVRTRAPTTPKPAVPSARTKRPTTRAPRTTKKPLITTAKPKAHTHDWKPIPPGPSYPPKPEHTLKPTPKSVPEDYDVCSHSNCGNPKERPLLESGATVYLVVGVKNFHWRKQDLGHVMADNVGEIKYDKKFSQAFNFSNPAILGALSQLCELCKRIANNSHLVRNGSAQCLPIDAMPYFVRVVLSSVDACKDLPKTSYIYHSQQPAHAIGGLTTDGSAILWLGFAFESTTSKSKSYFEAYKEYEEWEEFIAKMKKGLAPNSPLTDMFQTSEFWPEVLMEIVAVNSAIYSVVLSMVICMVAVLLFTRHIRLLLVVFISITQMVCLVVGIFYALGWEIGGVEAISLSILVGSSVDYCVHLVEGYILAAKACPYKDDSSKAKQWRTGATLSHIGVSIISSALTTIIAAIPLTQTTIQPFAKFGQIIAINTSVCILYSLTVCTALLSTLAPAFFSPTWKSTLKSVVGTSLFIGLSILIMYIMSKAGITIPGPNGGSLFPK